uniref:Succinate-semialdehyde dehydrogenase (EC) n=1 Tax=Ganoderma boninense TaxID=34458 RepID=A0A5K1JYG2_9APHY|nr:Succinate-semialdehyde dehydrogenase (EC [Ganoderma boninense]
MREDSSIKSVYTSTAFSVNSRIRLPCGAVYDKLGDGQWHCYQGGVLGYSGSLPSNHAFPHGSEMSYNGRRCFIKDGDNWCPSACGSTDLPQATGTSLAFATLGRGDYSQMFMDPGDDWWSTSLQISTTSNLNEIKSSGATLDSDLQSRNSAASEGSSGIQILEQVEYRHGTQPVHDCLVEFHVDMPAAACGDVPDADRPAYKYDLVKKEKIVFRFGFAHINSCSYHPKQRTITRSKEKKGITRGRLAMLVAQEVKELVDALARNNTPLKAPDGRALKFEELVLVDVKRRSTASVQPTIGVRTTT